MKQVKMKHIKWDGSPDTAEVIYLAFLDALSDAGRGHKGETLFTGRHEMPQSAQAALAQAPKPVALVVETSGSTGAPKYVCLTLDALIASARASETYFASMPHVRSAATSQSQWLFTLPADHIAGLQILFRSALAGSIPVFLNQQSRFSAAHFAATAIELHRLPRTTPISTLTLTSLVPTQLTRLLTEPEPRAAGRALSMLRSFDAVLVGGAATPPSLLQRGRELGINLVTTYGSSETSGGCVYNGRPLDGTSIRVAPDTQRIAIHGDMLLSGYLAARESGFTFIDPCRIESGQRWLHTQDAGILHPDGRLGVLGRIDDIIISGGVNVPPQRVESLLVEEPEVLDAVVVGVLDSDWGQRVVALVTCPPELVPAPGRQPGLEPENHQDAWLSSVARSRIRERISTLLGPAHAPQWFYCVENLPLLSSGKVDRRAARSMVEQKIT